MIKKSLMKISFVGIGNGLNAALGLAFLAAVAKSLDLHTFGIYSLLTSLLVLFSRLIDFGTNSVFVAGSISHDSKKYNDMFYTVKLILFALCVPLSLVVLSILKLNDAALLSIFLSGLIAYGFNFTAYALFQRLESYTYLVLINTLPAFIKGVFAGLIFMDLLHVSLQGAFAIFAISIFASSFLYIFVPAEMKKFKIDIRSAWELIRTALPAGVSQIIYEGWPALNNTIAKISRNYSDVGVFSLASKISNVFSIISLSIFTVLLPKNASRKRQNLSYDFAETFLLSAGIFLFALITIIVSQFFLVRVFGDKFSESLKILNLLTFASAFTAIHTFMENYFFVEEKTVYLMVINSLKLLIFVGSATLLINSAGIFGLALANLIAAVSAVILAAGLIIRTHSVRS